MTQEKSVISKELFVELIEALRFQDIHDNKTSELLSEAFGTNNIPLHDNSILTKVILKVLQVDFPPINDFCEIIHYCYYMNFGKFEEDEYFSPEQLYDNLIIKYP